jgi:GT2 family glycosyltransferase
MEKKLRRAVQVIKYEGLEAFARKLSGWIRRSTAGARARLIGHPFTPETRGLNPLDYARWTVAHEPVGEELARQTEQAKALTVSPRISLIVPIYHPQPDHLEAALDSLLAQTYPYWQACLAVGGPQSSPTHQILDRYAALDSRFHLTWLDANLGISGNSNRALEIAQGEFAAFLDQDDTLAPFALWEVAQALNQRPTCDLIYSDHDLLSAADGQRCQPLFKPDWSPELMLSANYLTHLTVARTALVRQVGGFDPHFDGAQDWDLFLRLSQQTDHILHIPKILYHWRTSLASTADDIYNKPHAPHAQTRAIQAHLDRLGFPEARAYFDPSGYLRVGWAFDRQVRVSIIIPTRGASRMLKTCLGSILRLTTYPAYEIILVNNGPRLPEQIRYFRNLVKNHREARIKIVHLPGAFNYSAANNYGAQQADGDVLVFLNNDTRVFSPDWLDELSMWAQRPEVGAVGGKLLRPDGSIQHAGVILGLTGFAGHIFGGLPENQGGIFGRAEWYRDLLAVTGACLAIRRQAFEGAGGFDEKLSLCGNDVALCLKLRAAGLRVVYNPFVRLLHREGATREAAIPDQDYVHSYEYYQVYLQDGDPYFNPNLSPWHLAPTLAAPGEISPLEFVHDFLQPRYARGEQPR